MARQSVQVPGLHHGDLPIPQASVVGDLLVSGGISPLDPETGTIPPGVDEQVELVFGNARRVLVAAGGRADDVIKVTAFVTDRGIRPVIDRHWVELFPDPESRPARHTLRMELPEPLHVQLEITAVLGKG